MPDEFHVRLATIADSRLIAWHRARMFQDMGYVPAELFDDFRAKSEVRLGEALASGDYVGWLASERNSLDTIIGGAGIQLRRVLPHPIREAGGEITICDSRQGVILNVFTEPEWRRRGIAALLMKTIIEWSRAQCLEELVLHASDDARALYEQLGFVSTNEMRFSGNLGADSEHD
jgi:GNAT superfamily N-acetyltransferase